MLNKRINERYEILKLIGEGGMANVYLALDTILDRQVAIKILRGDLATDEKFVKKFQREALSASSLNHPNIVEIYDVGEDEGKYYIVMEYVEGTTLKNLIKKRDFLSVPEVLDVMKQLTSAVACAHSNYIIHRDIKPQNVLITEMGKVKITDFGIAVALNEQSMTQTNSVMGSVHYLPPEQARGNVATIKSDIYSLGIVMYELLIGKVPFKGDNAIEVALKHMKEPMPSVRKIKESIPQSIENIVLKSTAKNPLNRYNSVDEMYNDLEECLEPKMIDVPKVKYQFPEKIESKKTEQEVEEKPIKKKKSKLTKIVIISGITFFLLALTLIFAIILYPKFTTVKEAKLPDLSGYSVVDAENKLKELGFVVNTEVEEKSSNEIEEGNVVGTSPIAGRTIKTGTMVTLIISTGENGLTLESYVGKNYYEAEAFLKSVGMYVIPERKTVENADTYQENIIISQQPEAGVRIVEGDTVTLTIPDVITKYPNFTDGTWTTAEVQKFCDTYNLKLTIDYQQSVEDPDGKILSQSRTEGTKVTATASLKIVVVKN